MAQLKPLPPVNHETPPVVIEPPAAETWLNVLADIGRTLRFQAGDATRFLELGDETVVHDPKTGSLTVKTSMNGQSIEMFVPPGLWSWKKEEGNAR